MRTSKANAHRYQLEMIVEQALALLDAMDGDPDIEENGDEHDMAFCLSGCCSPFNHEDAEDGGDDEPTMGATTDINQSAWASGSWQWDECEEENEHGGDIQDEAHDAVDQGDDELTLGWPEGNAQRGTDMPEPFSASYDASDSHEHALFLGFDGSGYHKAKADLVAFRRRRPDIHQNYVAVSPGY
ncbi:hypothetical protein HWD97_02465 [Ochrobactrum sp. C6C9]|uniref:hypothetical protein n=1 Tax=Ochrobactrum sp. C6C9 TaxID=2736662 RepID=UPI0035303CB4|nr:hypothetical protein [Ochrobactrum sp. C6C9]